jgi:hypothetical protein
LTKNNSKDRRCEMNNNIEIYYFVDELLKTLSKTPFWGKLPR